MLDVSLRRPSVEDQLAITQALYFEARLLDEERFEDWLDVICEDVAYRMALSGRRFRADRSKPAALGTGYIFNENRARLALRIDRLRSGYVWAEDPPNFVRRVVSNVEIIATDSDHEVEVRSVVVIHRNRIDGMTRNLVGGRKDMWRKIGESWRLACRDIVLDHTVVPDSNLNVFF